jgi:hypothetical protein
MISEQLAKIKELIAKRFGDSLMHSLECSFAIETLWPEAFAHGAVHSNIVGSRASGYHFTIRNGADEVREYQIKEVPSILLERYKDILNWKRR